MRFWDRVSLGFRIVFGLRFGIILDQDYADGGDLSGFDIEGADIGILVMGSPGLKEKHGILIEGNEVKARTKGKKAES